MDDELEPKEQEESLVEQPDIEAIRAESEKYKDAMLRAIAETQNVRSRYQIELEEAKQYSIWAFAKEMIEVSDSIRLALTSSKGGLKEVKELLDGLGLIKAQLEKVFLKFHIEEIIPSQGDEFDCQLHHAIAQVEDPNFKTNSVTAILQTGYRIRDRLIRPALVKVAL